MVLRTRRSDQYYPIIESVFYDMKTKIIHIYIYVRVLMFNQLYGNGDILYAIIRIHNSRYAHIDR